MMKQLGNWNKLLFGIVCGLVFTSFKPVPVNKSILPFSLLNVDGKQVAMSDYPNAKGFIVVFTCNHCPFAKLYPERLNKLNNKFKPLGVPVLAVSSTDTIIYDEDTYIKMQEKSSAENFNFPYLYDGNQLVAKQFNADKTPHAFVIWKVNNKWIVKYNGAIDDNGAEENQVTMPYVEMAVNNLLKGQSVKIKSTKSVGCQIYFRK